jgi:hypothetical protein
MSLDNELSVGHEADFVLFGKQPIGGAKAFRWRKTTKDVIYDPGHDRITIFKGKVVSN